MACEVFIECLVIRSHESVGMGGSTRVTTVNGNVAEFVQLSILSFIVALWCSYPLNSGFDEMGLAQSLQDGDSDASAAVFCLNCPAWTLRMEWFQKIMSHFHDCFKGTGFSVGL